MGGAGAVACIGRGGGQGPARRFRRILSPDWRHFGAFRHSPNENSTRRRRTKPVHRRPVGPVRFNFASRGRLNAARLWEVIWREVAIRN